MSSRLSEAKRSARARRISNEEAGLYLRAFDLKEPWATHRKYQVFEEKHADLFGRRDATADKIVLCQILSEEISDGLRTLKNQLFAKYVLAKFFLMYVLREKLLDNDDLADAIHSDPAKFVESRKPAPFSDVCEAIGGGRNYRPRLGGK